jgi:hypothetical protein
MAKSCRTPTSRDTLPLARAAPGHFAAVRGPLIDVLTAELLSALADGLGEVARRLGG